MKTMIKISNVLIAVVLISLFTGCACYYAPNAQNVPQFSEKGQVHASASYQLGSITEGVNLQGATAVSEKAAIMGNYNYYADNSITTSHMGEFGIGYFKRSGNKNNRVFETFAGMGLGRVKVDSEDGLQLVNTTSVFLQPDIGFVREKFRFAFSTRFRFVHFNVVRDDYTSSDYMYTDPGDGQCNTGYIEPACTFTFGGRLVRFQYQVMISYTFGDIVYYDSFNNNFGLVFCIPPKSRKH